MNHFSAFYSKGIDILAVIGRTTYAICVSVSRFKISLLDTDHTALSFAVIQWIHFIFHF